jgi:general secretion pathway protein D
VVRQTDGTVVLRFDEGRAQVVPTDADLSQVAEAVHMATQRTLIIDRRAHALVTMLSSTPMTPEGFYQAFLAILQVHGFVAVPEGNVIKILPNPSAL